MTAAAGVILAGGLGQLAASAGPATLIAIAAIAASLIAIRVLRPGKRTVPLQPLPPAPQFFERLPVIDGDELAKLRRTPHYEAGSVTQALREMEAEYRRQQGGNRG